MLLKRTEALLSGDNTLRLMGDHIESHRLTQGTALSNGDNVTFLNRKRRRAMHCNVGMTLLETTVF